MIPYRPIHVQTIGCPFCKYPVEVDMEWAARNGRVFCGTCCKAFDVNVAPPASQPPRQPQYDGDDDD